LTVTEKGSSFYCCDVNRERRGGLGVYEDGQASLGFSAAGKDRHIKMWAANDGNLYFFGARQGRVPLDHRL
jgi:hypothetical protein